MNIVWNNFIYTKLCKSDKKSKIKDCNNPRNEPLIVIDYCLGNIEEYSHLHNPENINLYDKYTMHNVINAINNMVDHINSI